MKTKHITGVLLASLLFSAVASASTELPFILQVTPAVAVNSTPTMAKIGTLPAKVTIADAGLNKVTRIGTALRIQFLDKVTGLPVNVTDFKAAKFDSSLVENGAPFGTWTQVPLGAYHPAAQGSPDYYCFTADNTDVSPASGYVAGWRGDGSGTTIPSMSRFILDDQTIVLGDSPPNPVWPKMTKAGDYYSLSYSCVFDCTFNGVRYTNITITPAQTEVMVLVIDGLPEFVNDEVPVPYTIKLQVSCDLIHWVVPAGVAIPQPRPTNANAKSITDLVPDTTDVPGLPIVPGPIRNPKRQYRFVGEPLVP